MGAAIDAGVQLAKQKATTGKIDWKCLDVMDMAISGVASGVFPGVIGAGRKVVKSAGAAKELARQVKNASGASRIEKLNGRINFHKTTITEQLITQGSVQGGKAVLKAGTGCPASDECEGAED